MELAMLGLLVLICASFAQSLLVPLHVANAVHLTLPLWLSSVQSWIGLGLVLFLGAWLISDG